MFKNIFIFIIFTLFSIESKADSVSAKITPLDPIVGENFFLDIDVETASDDDPYITFNKDFAEVLGRSMQGVSLNSTLINGRLTTKRVVKYRYELVANRPGVLRIKDIKALINGQEYIAKPVRVEIARARKEAPDIFLKAVLSKNKAYLGEGVTVNYYLYYRVPVIDTETKRFPKLNNFIKRFHMPTGKKERIQFDNKLYTREIKYSARVFPEKAGKLKIDPLQISVRYETVSSNRNFGFFPFQTRRARVRSLTSSIEELDVVPLPTSGMPKNFSGLVGKHEIRLHMPRTKFLVNEAVEYSLEVKGPGNLESMEEIKVYSDDNLEYFDSKVDFSEVDRINAKKVFEFTVLGRDALEIRLRDLKIWYFNPETKQFEFNLVSAPGIIVGGSAQGGYKKTNEQNAQSESQDSQKDIEKDASIDNFSGVLAPVFTYGSLKGKIIDWVNIALALIVALMGMSILFNVKISPRKSSDVSQLYKRIKRNGASFTYVYPLIRRLDGTTDNENLTEVIKRSNLSDDAKNYFESLVSISEKNEYDMGSKKRDFIYNNGYFKELEKEIRRVDENIKKS